MIAAAPPGSNAPSGARWLEVEGFPGDAPTPECYPERAFEGAPVPWNFVGELDVIRVDGAFSVRMRGNLAGLGRALARTPGKPGRDGR